MKPKNKNKKKGAELRAIARARMLEHQRQNGHQRVDSWGGKPSCRKSRRDSKMKLRKGEF